MRKNGTLEVSDPILTSSLHTQDISKDDLGQTPLAPYPQPSELEDDARAYDLHGSSCSRFSGFLWSVLSDTSPGPVGLS